MDWSSAFTSRVDAGVDAVVDVASRSAVKAGVAPVNQKAMASIAARAGAAKLRSAEILSGVKRFAVERSQGIGRLQHGIEAESNT